MRKKNRPKRKKLPENLERIEVIINPNPLCPSCGGELFRKISDDISEVLEYIHHPSKYCAILDQDAHAKAAKL